MLNAMESISSGVTRLTSVCGISDAVYAQVGMVADLQMKVGGLVFDSAAQQIVDTLCHMGRNSLRSSHRS